MGLLDSLIGALGQSGQGSGGLGGLGGLAAGLGGGRNNSQAALLNMVLSMLAGGGQGGGDGGGIADLMGRFQQAGLSDVMSSWISTGQNQAISPEQIGSVFGEERLGGLAAQLGMPRDDVAGQLSQLLPEVVDRLTPQGQVPAGGFGDLGSLLGMLARR